MSGTIKDIVVEEDDRYSGEIQVLENGSIEVTESKVDLWDPETLRQTL